MSKPLPTTATLERWNNLWRRLGIPESPRETHGELIAAYGEKHRAYLKPGMKVASEGRVEPFGDHVHDQRHTEEDIYQHHDGDRGAYAVFLHVGGDFLSCVLAEQEYWQRANSALHQRCYGEAATAVAQA